MTLDPQMLTIYFQKWLSHGGELDKRFQVLSDIYKQITNKIHDIIMRNIRSHIPSLLKGYKDILCSSHEWIYFMFYMQLSHQDGFDENPRKFQLPPTMSPFYAHKNISLYIFVPASRDQILMKSIRSHSGHNLRQTELLSDNFAEIRKIECWDFDREIM